MLDLIIMILVGALIGWFTNFLAVKLLFRPYREVNVLGIKIQGLVPKRKHDISVQIAKTVDEHLISVKDITATMESIEIDSEIERLVNRIVKKNLKEDLIKKFPMAGMFLNESTMEKIKDYIKNAILDNKEELVEIVAKKVEEGIDFKDIVREKIDDFSLIQLERIIVEIAAKELRHIELIGGILGGIIGVVQFILIRVIL